MDNRALVLMSFSLLVAGSARADLISVNFAVDRLEGAGFFHTDGLCSVCTADNGLSDFTLSLGGDFFSTNKVTFFRASNSLSASLTGIDDVLSRLLFTPSGNVQFSGKEHGHEVVLHGDYALSGDPVSVSSAAKAVAAVPEAGSVALLLTAVGLIAVGKWRTRLHG
jgi:hypothetical protein